MDTKRAIIEEFAVAYSALVKVYDLASGDIGSSEWFCNGYPFGMDLFEFLAEVQAYIEKLEGASNETDTHGK